MLIADFVDIVWKLIEGNPHAWITFGVLSAVIAGMAIYERITGSDVFHKSRKARRRRKHVLWEYKRDKSD